MMKKQPILTTIFAAALTAIAVGCGTTPGAQTGNQGQKSYHLQVQGANGRQVQQGTRTIHVSSPTGGLYVPTNNSGSASSGGAASGGGTAASGNNPTNGGGSTTIGTSTTTTRNYQSLPTSGNSGNGGSNGVGVKQTNTNKGSRK